MYGVTHKGSSSSNENISSIAVLIIKAVRRQSKGVYV